MATVTEFGEKTTGTEVAERFASSITGRTSKLTSKPKKDIAESP